MVDIIQNVQTLLSDNWSPGNTGSRTPLFTINSESKRKDLGFLNKDLIVLWEQDEFNEDLAVGGGNKQITSNIIIDIRTVLTRDQAILLYEEVRRIVIAKEKNDPFGDASFDILDLTEKRETESYSNFWRYTCKLRVIKYLKTF